MATVLSAITAVLQAIFKGKEALILENLALRQQLGTYLRKERRPILASRDRFFWVILSKIWDGWRSVLS
jgi:hypothetical protein